MFGEEGQPDPREPIPGSSVESGDLPATQPEWVT